MMWLPPMKICQDAATEAGVLALQLAAPLLSATDLTNGRATCAETSQTSAFVARLVSLVDPSSPEVFVATGDLLENFGKHRANLELNKHGYVGTLSRTSPHRERYSLVVHSKPQDHQRPSMEPEETLLHVAFKVQRFTILFARRLLEQRDVASLQRRLVPDLLRILSECFEQEQISVCRCLSNCAPYLGDLTETFIHELNRAKERFRSEGRCSSFATFQAELELKAQKGRRGFNSPCRCGSGEFRPCMCEDLVQNDQRW